MDYIDNDIVSVPSVNEEEQEPYVSESEHDDYELEEEPSKFLYVANLIVKDYKGRAVRDENGYAIKRPTVLVNYGKLHLHVKERLLKDLEVKEKLKKMMEEEKKKNDVDLTSKLNWKTKERNVIKKEKDDDYFPLLTLENLEKKREEIKEEEWVVKVVRKNKKDVKTNNQKPTKKSMFCISVLKKIECPHADCNFAHTEEELHILDCDYGLECRYIQYDRKKDKICQRRHPYETDNGFFARVLRKPKVKEIKVKESKVKESKVKESKVKEIKVKESKVKEIKVKEPIYKKENPQQVFISRRNSKMNEIKSLSISISRLEDMMRRDKKFVNDNIKKQIETKQKTLIILKDEYASISIEEIRKEIDDKYEEQKKEIVVEPVVIKIDIDIKPKIVIEQPKVEPKPQIKQVSEFKGWCNHPLKNIEVEDQTRVKEKEKEKEKENKDNGWIQVKEKEKIINTTNTKTQMCNNFFTKEKCKFNTRCKFAHNLQELKISDCAYGKLCKMVKVNGKTYINKYEKVCCYKHPNETLSNVFDRLRK